VLSSCRDPLAWGAYGFRASILTFGLFALGCSEQYSGLDDSPASLAKLPPKLQAELSAGLARDVLVELDEQTAAASGTVDAGSAVRGMETGALQSNLGDLSLGDAEPMRAIMLAERAKRYQALQEKVLNSVDPAEVSLLFQYENLPLLFVHVRSQRGALELAGLPEVLRLHENEQLEHQLTESLPLIHQPEAAAAGKAGAGTAVAVLDTGCDFSRAPFGSCTSAGAAGCKVAYAADFAPEDGSRDDNGHGTNVSAIVLGVAPSSKVIALDVFDGAGAPSSAILQAVDWTIKNRTTYNIVAMNMSLGGGLFTSACTNDVFATALANARSAGVVPVIASGNNGSSTSVASPACVPAAVSVGAVYDANVGGLSYPSVGCNDSSSAADKITCFSNSNALLSMLAPGATITAGGYTMTGTSQATPHVAGAMAVVRSAFPNEALNDSVARLTGTGPMIADSRNSVSRHRLDLQAALSGGSGVNNPPPDTKGPTGSVVINGDAAATRSANVTLTITGSDPSGVPSMCVSNTSTCTTFSSFATSKTWLLASGDGAKSVWVILKDGAGNQTVLTDTIRLDTTLPIGAVLSAAPSGGRVVLTWTAATDSGGSGIAGYTLVVAANTPPASCAAGTPIYSGTATTYTHVGLVNGNVYGYHVCPLDLAGNAGNGTTASARPAPEYDAPRGSLIINGGAALTASTAATLTLTATDASGTAAMCIANATTCTTWIAFASSKPWTLAATNGATTVNVWFRDIYGNTSATPVSATIKVDTTQPTMGALSATAGAGQVALSWTAATDASGIDSYKLVWQAGTVAPSSCTAGGVAYSGPALMFTHSGRSAGNYSYRLCAIDRAGNVAPGVSRSVTVR
jgi:subtilisin family serine protease